MKTTWPKLRSRLVEDVGASLVEYALLLVLIAVIAIAAISIVGGEVDSAFVEVGSGF